MINFTPAFRITEVEETGEGFAHVEEGVIGYAAQPIDWSDMLGPVTAEDQDLVDRAFADLRASSPQVPAWPLNGRTVISAAEMHQLAIAAATWVRDRRDSFVAEQSPVKVDA